jgi:hypothetical protein
MSANAYPPHPSLKDSSNCSPGTRRIKRSIPLSSSCWAAGGDHGPADVEGWLNFSIRSVTIPTFLPLKVSLYGEGF